MQSCLTPKGQLRASPAPSQLNCDTSYYQLLHTDRSARRLHPTLYRDRSSRYSLSSDQHSGRPANGGNGDPHVIDRTPTALGTTAPLLCSALLKIRCCFPAADARFTSFESEATQRALDHATTNQAPSRDRLYSAPRSQFSTAALCTRPEPCSS